jgi:hypothetical protein
MGIGPAISKSGKTSSLSSTSLVSKNESAAKMYCSCRTAGPVSRQHKFFVGDPCHEIGGDQIPRAGKGDPAIHDRDLAMGAQVQPCSLTIEETDGQGRER